MLRELLCCATVVCTPADLSHHGRHFRISSNVRVVPQLVHLHPGPHTIRSPPSSPSTTLEQSGEVVEGRGEDNYINSLEINTEKDPCGRQEHSYLVDSLHNHLFLSRDDKCCQCWKFGETHKEKEEEKKQLIL